MKPQSATLALYRKATAAWPRAANDSIEYTIFHHTPETCRQVTELQELLKAKGLDTKVRRFVPFLILVHLREKF